QEGAASVAFHLIGRAIKETFNERHVPMKSAGKRSKEGDFSAYQAILDWFDNGNVVELSAIMPQEEFRKTLQGIGGLDAAARKLDPSASTQELLVLMEFILESLHQNFLLTKHVVDARIRYTDAVSYMMNEAEEE